MTITITSSGDDVSMDLKGVARRVKRPLPALRQVGSFIAASNRRQFATHGAYYGKPWKPLQPDYLQWKIRNGYSRRTLVMTGDMRVSFVSRPMSIEKYYGDSATFGSDHWLAKFHQYGTYRNGRRAIPPRPIMKKTKVLVRGVAGIIKGHVLGKKVKIRDFM